MNIDEANSVSHYITRIVYLEKWGWFKEFPIPTVAHLYK